MKKIVLLLLLPAYCIAQLPDYYTYYESVDFNLSGEAIKAQLATLVTETHTTELIYTPGVWDALKQTDLDPENNENVLLIYGYDDTDGVDDTDRSRDKDLSCHTSSCAGLWVREHVFPRSLGNPNLEFEGPGSDAHHLRAIDSERNSMRSNRRFADGEGHSIAISGGFFYPGDEWRGDVARMMMYMYIRYGQQCEANVVGSGSSSYSTLGDMPNIFLEWNAEDPVSQYEKNRNDILQDMQGNRNPFIDDPYIATIIWDGPAAEDTWGTLATQMAVAQNFFVYPTVTEGTVYVNNAPENTTYTLYNSLGQRINVTATANTIELEGNAKGMYFLSADSEAMHQTVKLILK
ncbi:endonuclease [Flavobacterium rhizosphaerae]|uniref:Endonuclease n=1 Tax=Flavobacterium rhizosphaerae TaxID=3163298 RepID=A0ABW8YTL2_9FLAO